MIGRILSMYSGLIVVVLLSIPLSAFSATQINIDFDTVIEEATGTSYPPHRLHKGNTVTGSFKVDANDFLGSANEQIDFLGGQNLTVEVYQGPVSFGSALSNAGWSFSSNDVGLATIDNYQLVAGDLDDIPGYVTPQMYPNLPQVGDVIDMVFLVAFGPGPFVTLERKIGLGLLYDSVDGVVTGTGLSAIDDSKLISAANYGEFLAEDTFFSGSTHWDAVGSVAASPVPVPAAVWIFGSGLLGLIGIARGKKAIKY